ncbi:hypothetical protein F5Y15DRAFT_26581 [Xylariaceae sp. FL0016]|nr:hypothetical protein F5Y15DRAFT_26581 [Xylariaceae sp. FL0016]
MALLALSLVLATIVWISIRRPIPMEKLWALWKGEPRAQDTASQAQNGHTDSSKAEGSTENTIASSSSKHDAPNQSTADLPPAAESKADAQARAQADRAAMPPPPAIAVPTMTSDTPSPQTTPKASAVASSPSLSSPTSGSIPSFSLSASPPASAAAIARTTAPPSHLPSITGTVPTATNPSAAPAPPRPAPGSMAPPPPPGRLPTLKTINNTSSLSVPSSRSSPLPNRSYDRQPGTSTLAPPTSHSAKPSKPSRKVTLSPGHSPLDWARLSSDPSPSGGDLRGAGFRPSDPYIRVTPSQLKRQTGRRGKDAWTALGGRVYNITPYIPFHPGGGPELLRCAGRDGTALFGEIHPWVNYETMLSACLVGLLVEEHEGADAGGGDMEAMD